MPVLFNPFDGTIQLKPLDTAGAGITSLTGDVSAVGPGAAVATINPGVITNSMIAVSAAIARSKLAAGSANHVVINDGTGALSSEAQLSITRGGTGQSNKTAAFDALSPLSTVGDLIAFDGTNNVVLSPGPDGTVLTADSAVAEGLSYQPLNVVLIRNSDFTPATRTINLVNTAASRNVNLPAPSADFVCYIKDATGQAETNPVVLVPNGAELIEGLAASKELRTNWGGWQVVSDGTNWYLV